MTDINIVRVSRLYCIEWIYCEHCYMTERNTVRGSGLYSIEWSYYEHYYMTEKYCARFRALIYRVELL